MAKKEKWKVENSRGDKGRLVVDQDNALIADCYADTSDPLGIPQDYKKMAKRIALQLDPLGSLRTHPLRHNPRQTQQTETMNYFYAQKIKDLFALANVSTQHAGHE
jgi:hypothetical protein